MNTTTTAPETLNALQLLRSFAFQRPGLDFNDYGDLKYYRQDSREITKDLHDFIEAFDLCCTYIDNLSEKVQEKLLNSSDRLTLENGKLKYITGQYFPTEYRPAATRVLTSILWRHFASKYETGGDIRKALKRITSRRFFNNYFA